MNLSDWMNLASGDLVTWHDELSGPFYELTSSVPQVNRDKHCTWPLAWNVVPVDPSTMTKKQKMRDIIYSDWRDFWCIYKGTI